MSLLQGEPPGGTFTIDGVQDSSLNPAALGLGDHMATYTYVAELDSIAFIDQTTGIGSYASGGQGTVAVGTPIWQSFTPATMTLDLYGHRFPDQLVEVASRLDAAARAAVYPLCTRAEIVPLSAG